MKVANVPMRLILGLPVATPLGKRLMLVYLTGRRTGRPYRQPVSYVRHGGTLLTPGGGRWKLNLVEGRAERIRLRGRDLQAHPEIIDEVAEVERLLAEMAKASPMAARFVGVKQDAVGHFDRAQLERAIRYGFRIVRWHLDEPAQDPEADGP